MTTHAQAWRTSSYSGNNGGNCVEVSTDGDHVLIRDSKYRRDPSNDPATQPIIAVTALQWNTFLGAIAESAATPTEPTIVMSQSGRATLRAADGTSLLFTPPEWTAFVDGVIDGEFDELVSAA